MSARSVRINLSTIQDWPELAAQVQPANLGARVPQTTERLIHLPFNFLGGFRSPVTLLQRLRHVPGALLLVSVFNTSDYSTHVRRRYYSACGVEALAVSGCSRDTVTFTGERNFYSRAFTPDTLRALFDKCEIDTLCR